jgi:hypothetical protein
VLPDIEDLRKQSRDADREDLRRAELFRSLVRTEGWQEYIKLLDAKVQAFSDQLLAPAKSVDGMVESEWIKGAMSGLIMARDVASVTIAAIEQLRRSNSDQAEDDDHE